MRGIIVQCTQHRRRRRRCARARQHVETTKRGAVAVRTSYAHAGRSGAADAIHAGHTADIDATGHQCFVLLAQRLEWALGKPAVVIGATDEREISLDKLHSRMPESFLDPYPYILDKY